MSVHLLLLHEHHLLHLLLLHRQHLLLLRRHLHIRQPANQLRQCVKYTQLKGHGAHLSLALLRVELLKPLLPALVRMLLAAPTLSITSAVSERRQEWQRVR